MLSLLKIDWYETLEASQKVELILNGFRVLR